MCFFLLHFHNNFNSWFTSVGGIMFHKHKCSLQLRLNYIFLNIILEIVEVNSCLLSFQQPFSMIGLDFLLERV